VWIYSALHYLTAGGADIKLAQYVFAGLYVAVLAIVLAIYRRTPTVYHMACVRRCRVFLRLWWLDAHLVRCCCCCCCADAGVGRGAAVPVQANPLHLWSQVRPRCVVLRVVSCAAYTRALCRLFNDCWAMFFMFAAILALLNRRLSFATLLYSYDPHYLPRRA
jgi:hypothetical protein